MTDPEDDHLTEIVLLVDRSGSMENIRDDAIGGINAFLSDQRREPGRATITLVLFDDEYLVVERAADIGDVAPLTRQTFVPRGTTALLDAWGRAMAETSERVNKLPEDEQPDDVVFVVVTDGYENASKEYSRDVVFRRVDRLTDDEGWRFVYLGANQDAVAEGTKLGVRQDSAMTFSGDHHGTVVSLIAVSAGVSRLRRGTAGDEFFTESEREEQERLLKKKKKLH